MVFIVIFLKETFLMEAFVTYSAICSPGGARGGIRSVRPKQALTVSGGRVVSSPLGSGVKSGIRPIEAMLGAGAHTPTTSATPTSSMQVTN